MLYLHITIISNKTPNMFSAIYSEINTVSNKHNTTLKCEG